MPLPALPSLSVKWGPYDQPDPEEEAKIVTTVRTAMGGGAGGGEPLITKRMAIEKLREVFPIESVDATLEALEEEQEERQKKMLEQTTAEADALHKIAGNGAAAKPGGPPPSGGPGGGALAVPAPKAKGLEKR